MWPLFSYLFYLAMHLDLSMYAIVGLHLLLQAAGIAREAAA